MLRSPKPLFLLLTMMLIAGCRRDPIVEGPWTGGTPLQLEIPAWAITSMNVPNIPIDDPLTVEGVRLGRMLFHEKALSNDRSISCASCHAQQHAFTDPRPFSIGTNGTVGTRNGMPLMNLVFDRFFFWDSRAASLELQALRPVVDPAEMRNSWPVVVQRLQADDTYPGLFKQAFGTEVIDSMLVVRAIAQFERTLLSFNSRFDRFNYGGDTLALTPQEKRGFDLFMNEASCGGCHMPPMFTDHSIRNNGLDMVPLDLGLGNLTGVREDEGRFKTPSLRNIGTTAPYMHDSRFATLEDVLDFYAEDVQVNSASIDPHMLPWIFGNVDLDQQDRADIVAFLHSLSDPQFLADPAFSDPH